MSNAAEEVEFVHPDLVVDIDGVISYGWVRPLDGQQRMVAPGVFYPHLGLRRTITRVDFFLPAGVREGR